MKTHSYEFKATKLSENRRKIEDILAKYAGEDASDLFAQIERLVGEYYASEEPSEAAYEKPSDIRKQLDRIASAMTCLSDDLAFQAQGSARHLIVGALADRNLIEPFAVLEEIFQKLGPMLTEAVNEAAHGYQPKNYRPDSIPTGNRRRLVKNIEFHTREYGLPGKRAGDFARLIELLWKSIGIDIASDTDIQAAGFK